VFSGQHALGASDVRERITQVEAAFDMEGFPTSRAFAYVRNMPFLGAEAVDLESSPAPGALESRQVLSGQFFELHDIPLSSRFIAVRGISRWSRLGRS
jgi:hypothetical protein